MLFLWVVIVFMVSCEKNDLENNFEERKQEFVGKWGVFQRTTVLENDSLTNIFEGQFNVDFKENGLVIEEKSPVLGSDTLNWFYQLYPEKLIFISEISGNISNAIIYDIVSVDNNYNEIEMHAMYSQISFSNPSIIIKYEIERFMKRL